jgi:phosphate transport system ATP-binding protein
MDPVAMMRLEDLFQELKKMYSLIVVTHNMQQAARCADETALLVQGRLVEYGTSDDFFSMPKKRETENYITGRFSQEVRSGGKDKI